MRVTMERPDDGCSPSVVYIGCRILRPEPRVLAPGRSTGPAGTAAGLVAVGLGAEGLLGRIQPRVSLCHDHQGRGSVVSGSGRPGRIVMQAQVAPETGQSHSSHPHHAIEIRCSSRHRSRTPLSKGISR